MSEAKVPKGYKLTEVGVIPDEWGITSVGNEFDIQLGKMLDIQKNIGIPKPYLGNSAVQWGEIKLDPIDYIKMNLDDLKKYRLEKNDILVCEGGEVGRAAIWDQPINECYYQKALHRLRPSKTYDIYFFYFYLQKITSSSSIANYVTKTSIAHLPKDKFEIVPLPLPPLPEQRAIAEALSDVDSLLSALDKLIEKKRAIKQGAMQELLTGRKRLPGFSGKWEKKKLGAIMRICHGKSQESIILENGKYPILATGGEIGRTDSYIHPGPSVLIGRKGTIDKPHYIATPFWTIDTLFYSEIFDGIDAKFVYYYFLTVEWYALNEASGVPSLNASRIEKIDLLLPPLPEQIAIATILSDMDADIEALERRRDKTKAIKQGMMQELLTGRIRLV